MKKYLILGFLMIPMIPFVGCYDQKECTCPDAIDYTVSDVSIDRFNDDNITEDQLRIRVRFELAVDGSAWNQLTPFSFFHQATACTCIPSIIKEKIGSVGIVSSAEFGSVSAGQEIGQFFIPEVRQGGSEVYPAPIVLDLGEDNEDPFGWNVWLVADASDVRYIEEEGGHTFNLNVVLDDGRAFDAESEEITLTPKE